MIDINKKYRFRNGQPARILCVDAFGAFPVKSLDEEGDVCGHLSDGCYYDNHSESEWDLIEVSDPRVLWVNFYAYMGPRSHESKEKAEKNAYSSRIACRKFIEAPEDQQQ